MQGSQIYLPPMTKVNKVLLIAIGSCFLLNAIIAKTSGVSLIGAFGLSAEKFTSGYIHSLITYPFFETSLIGVIFDGLILWFIGSELEVRWGAKGYITFLAASALTAGIIYLVFSALFFSSFLPIHGVTGISYSLLLAYAILFPDRILTFMLIFPMKAKYFCMLLMGMLLFTGFLASAQTAWGHLGAMFGGFAWMYWSAKYKALGTGKRSNSGKILNIFNKKKNTKLYIVRDEDGNDISDKDPKYWN